MEKRILVLGATGMLGVPVVKQLLNDGFQVRILVRDKEKANALFDGKVEIILGDVCDKDAVNRAMEGCSAVHISIGGDAEQTAAENVAALAPASGIERITYISGATVREENGWFSVIAQKLNAEKAILGCGVPHTIFCPSWAMEQLRRFARGGKPFMIGKQTNPVHPFAGRDLGAMVSRSYSCEEAANRRFFVFGPEKMAIVEALERYCQVVHPRGDKVSVMPVWLAKAMAALTRNDAMMFAANLMGYFDKTKEAGDAAEANRILNAPQTSLENWIEKEN